MDRRVKKAQGLTVVNGEQHMAIDIYLPIITYSLSFQLAASHFFLQQDVFLCEKVKIVSIRTSVKTN